MFEKMIGLIKPRHLKIGTGIITGSAAAFFSAAPLESGSTAHKVSPKQVWPKEAKKGQKSILITGANRGLGLILAEKLSKQGWEIYATARDEALLREQFAEKNIKFKGLVEWDLCQPPSQKKMDEIVSVLPKDLGAVVHCASPYTTEPLLRSSGKEIIELGNVMTNDTFFLQTMTNKLKDREDQTVLAVTGAVIGLPNLHSRGMMGMVKANQRQLAGVLDYERQQLKKQNFYVRHFNLGSFMNADDVTDHEQFLTTEYIADRVVLVLEHPELYSRDINVVSKKNEVAYGVRLTEIPQPLSKSETDEVLPQTSTPGLK